jgi:L-seryl-tRNA(Ser) seleniumtransferase
MLHATDLRERAEWLAARIPGATVIESTARVGGGALPLVELPGPVVALPDDALAEPLRRADPPLVGRVEDGRLLLDPRTLSEEELPLALAAVRAAGSSRSGSAESRP